MISDKFRAIFDEFWRFLYSTRNGCSVLFGTRFDLPNLFSIFCQEEFKKWLPPPFKKKYLNLPARRSLYLWMCLKSQLQAWALWWETYTSWLNDMSWQRFSIIMNPTIAVYEFYHSNSLLVKILKLNYLEQLFHGVNLVKQNSVEPSGLINLLTLKNSIIPKPIRDDEWNSSSCFTSSIYVHSLSL